MEYAYSTYALPTNRRNPLCGLTVEKQPAILLIRLEDAVGQVATTKLSSRGQIVIPEEIRKSLGFETGTKFVVLGQGDSIILKSISPPPMSRFKKLLAEARKSAKKAGFKKSDLQKIIDEVRQEK